MQRASWLGFLLDSFQLRSSFDRLSCLCTLSCSEALVCSVVPCSLFVLRNSSHSTFV